MISSSFYTQDGSSKVAIIPGQLFDSANGWDMEGVIPHGLPGDSGLPESVYICWSSLVDQAIYVTYVEFSKEIRQKMVEPYPYVYQWEHKVGYYDHILFGFAPRGHVTVWLVNTKQRNSAIEVATDLTKRYNPFKIPMNKATRDTPFNSGYCSNIYHNQKLPELTAEEKAWVKAHGIPPQWQEEVISSKLTPEEEWHYKLIEQRAKQQEEGK